MVDLLLDPQAIFEIEAYCMPSNNYDLNPLPICRLSIWAYYMLNIKYGYLLLHPQAIFEIEVYCLPGNNNDHLP